LPKTKPTTAENKRRSNAVFQLACAQHVCDLYGKPGLARQLQSLSNEIAAGKERTP
jgi:hypothetical protein